ncbi:hypothetical protein GLE_5151 [Lysobacter enzymogenes]|uniref:Uncharacterized protein n=1 Tax=Lysobacter enzymogenes TaxID=69 RepID=A0A0S2DPL6_LYSEN|nr:hypothetical protein GLE_5151 [Lysobacter enzymogenes]
MANSWGESGSRRTSRGGWNRARVPVLAETMLSSKRCRTAAMVARNGSRQRRCGGAARTQRPMIAPAHDGDRDRRRASAAAARRAPQRSG